MVEFYGPDGSVLTMEVWSELLERRREDMSLDSWWRRQTSISPDVHVSTVWLGLNHAFGDPAPLYWETMVFGGEYDEHQWRYSSRESALDDHERIVRALRKGRDPDA